MPDKIKDQIMCPRCDGYAYWRNGVHFEHLRRCTTCGNSYDPDDVVAESNKIIERLHAGFDPIALGM